MDFPLKRDRLVVLTIQQIEKTRSLGVDVAGMLSHFCARAATFGYLNLFTFHHERGSNLHFPVDIVSIVIKKDKVSRRAWTFIHSNNMLGSCSTCGVVSFRVPYKSIAFSSSESIPSVELELFLVDVASCMSHTAASATWSISSCFTADFSLSSLQ